MEQILNYLDYIIIGSMFFIFGIIIITLSVKLSKLKNKLEKFFKNNGGVNIENLLYQYFEKIKKVEEENLEIKRNILKIEENLSFSISKVGLIRYNPFENLGGDLCYALALLNEKNDGVILNSIYSADGCYTYAKPIKNGISEKYKLSDEENSALEIAINFNKK